VYAAPLTSGNLTAPNHLPTCAVSVRMSARARYACSSAGPAQAECVVEQMRNLASDPGCLALAGDVVTLQATWARPPAKAARQGSSVARLRTADREAAEELFNACYPRLAGWVRRLVDDDETAHEIAAEAFTRLLSRWSGLDNPQSYLYMIATNLVRDHWRKTSRERRAIRTITAAVPHEPAWHPAQDVDVRDLIESLPPRLRSAFLLHYYGGFAVKEVARLLGRPEGTVKADLHHARARLKAAVGEAT
jgi:RNA polymerase sigma-70 factor (ECF subfamily)